MNLFTPYTVLGLKNRAVMAPMTRFSCDMDGSPTDNLGEYYIRRAKQQVGLIIVESCAVNSRDAMGYKNGAQFHAKIHCEKWKPIVEKIHKEGAKVWIQLFHAGRLTVPAISEVQPLAPSAISPFSFPSFWRPLKNGSIVNFQTNTPYATPTEISTDEIKRVIVEFRNAVSLAEEAGFDGVELHGAHGYLLHLFCFKKTNKREDKYGYTETFNFASELVEACRSAVKNTFVLSYRLSLHMVDNPFIRYSPEDIDYSNLVKKLEKCGIDVFHSSEIHNAPNVEGAGLSLSDIIRQNTMKPIITCGNIKTLVRANEIVEKDENRLVGFGRNLISNYNLISLLKEQKESSVIKFSNEEHLQKLY